MTLEEKQELIKSATTEEELEARMKQIEEDKEEVKEETKEVTEEKSGEISKEEERKLIADTEELQQYSYLFDNSLSEYDILSRYINEDIGEIFITADELKAIVEQEF